MGSLPRRVHLGTEARVAITRARRSLDRRTPSTCPRRGQHVNKGDRRRRAVGPVEPLF